MKPKTIVTLVIMAGLVVSAISITRSCTADARLQKAKHDYEESRRVWEADHEIMTNRVGQLTSAVGQKDETIGQLEHKVAQYVDKLRHTAQELSELQSAEPVQPELETEPLVINLRGQVSKLTEMLSLSQQTITTQKQEIAELWGKCELLTQIGDEWKGAYERERALRVQCEGLFGACEKRLKMSKSWGTVKTIAIGAAVVCAAGSLIK